MTDTSPTVDASAPIAEDPHWRSKYHLAHLRASCLRPKPLDLSGPHPMDEATFGRSQSLLDRIAIALDWRERNPSAAEEVLSRLLRFLPSGSGIDGGCKLDEEACSVKSGSVKRIAFRCDFHCMSENGYYCGWYALRCVVTPDLLGAQVVVRGIGRPPVSSFDAREVRDLVGDQIRETLTDEMPEYLWHRVENPEFCEVLPAPESLATMRVRLAPWVGPHATPHVGLACRIA